MTTKNRSFSKLAYAREFVGNTESRPAAYLNVREEQSTGITHKLPVEVEFQKIPNIPIESQPIISKLSHNQIKLIA
jgi:2-polyprenyl-6-hydroxyphenyl methylase/3-demethylubiquinone-9 3-methyltransferase